jgi:hypothetical protein
MSGVDWFWDQQNWYFGKIGMTWEKRVSLLAKFCSKPPQEVEWSRHTSWVTLIDFPNAGPLSTLTLKCPWCEHVFGWWFQTSFVLIPTNQMAIQPASIIHNIYWWFPI